MVKCWVFSSRDKENIRRAYERLVWGFWDRDLAKSRRSKLFKNWRGFLRLYNSVSSGDVAFLQVARTGEIHAVGIVKERFYDDQTPVWDQELSRGKVLFPWRVSFYAIVYSEEPLERLFARLENYVDGYGVGELPHHEAERILRRLKDKLQSLNIGLQLYL